MASGIISRDAQQLDTLTVRLIPAQECEPEKQHDVEILASLPGVGRIDAAGRSLRCLAAA
jgi:hypothetical protein